MLQHNPGSSPELASSTELTQAQRSGGPLSARLGAAGGRHGRVAPFASPTAHVA